MQNVQTQLAASVVLVKKASMEMEFHALTMHVRLVFIIATLMQLVKTPKKVSTVNVKRATMEMEFHAAKNHKMNRTTEYQQ